MNEPFFNLTAYKDFWDWATKNPTLTYWEWPGWEQNGGAYKDLINDNFACDYAYSISTDDKFVDCRNCPIDHWVDRSAERRYFSYVESNEYKGDADGLCMYGVYGLWCDAYYARDLEKIVYYAKKIHGLPVKQHVVCE